MEAPYSMTAHYHEFQEIKYVSRCCTRGGGAGPRCPLPPVSRWALDGAPPGSGPVCHAGTGAKCACCPGWCLPPASAPPWPLCWRSSTWARTQRAAEPAPRAVRSARPSRAPPASWPPTWTPAQTRVRTAIPLRAEAGYGATPSPTTSSRTAPWWPTASRTRSAHGACWRGPRVGRVARLSLGYAPCAFFRSCLDMREMERLGPRPMLEVIEDWWLGPGGAAERPGAAARWDLKRLLYEAQGGYSAPRASHSPSAWTTGTPPATTSASWRRTGGSWSACSVSWMPTPWSRRPRRSCSWSSSCPTVPTHAPQLQWKWLLGQTFQEDFSEDEEVVLLATDYMQQVSQLIRSTSRRYSCQSPTQAGPAPVSQVIFLVSFEFPPPAPCRGHTGEAC
ncbi:endothelin-converting enzyme-like 1 [Saccopteryx bilineata]|uniref:endothelin-converting enzyme-like 1 n=1 Tax=Saccopteryx bilineata TaxID=59482 RepID=UPI00338DE6E5